MGWHNGDNHLASMDGEQRPPGLPGVKGESSDTGLVGLQDPQGIQGPNVDEGDKVDQGIKGDRGLQGAKGDKGDIGPQG